MSTCISREGEYSDHIPDDNEFVCGRCGAFDEDSAVAEVRRLRATVDSLRIDNHDWRGRCEAIRDAVTGLHSPASSPLAGPTWCVDCQSRPEEGGWWPCPTVTALDVHGRSSFGDDRTVEPDDTTIEAVSHVVDVMRERDEASAAIARVEALRPTHRHRGASWGDGDVEYVAYDDLRAALRGDV